MSPCSDSLDFIKFSLKSGIFSLILGVGNRRHVWKTWGSVYTLVLPLTCALQRRVIDWWLGTGNGQVVSVGTGWYCQTFNQSSPWSLPTSTSYHVHGVSSGGWECQIYPNKIIIARYSLILHKFRNGQCPDIALMWSFLILSLLFLFTSFLKHLISHANLCYTFID